MSLAGLVKRHHHLNDSFDHLLVDKEKKPEKISVHLGAQICDYQCWSLNSYHDNVGNLCLDCILECLAKL